MGAAEFNFNEETNMVRTIGLVVAGLGLLLLVFSIIIDKKDGIGNIKREFKLLTEKGYLKTHAGKGFSLSVYAQNMINPPKKRRKVSKEAREIMDRVDTAISPNNLDFLESEDDTAMLDEESTAVLDDETSTAVLDEDGTAVLDEDSTAVLDDEDTAVLDDNGTAVLDDEDTAVLSEDEDDFGGFSKRDITTILSEDEDNAIFEEDDEDVSDDESDAGDSSNAEDENFDIEDKISRFSDLTSEDSELMELKKRGTELLVALEEEENVVSDAIEEDDDYYDFENDEE